MKKLLILCLLMALACPVLASSNASADGSSVSQAVSAPLNVNRATVKELVKLPGIGKVTADKIVTYRTANGPFATLDDLLKVNGMGKKTLAKIRDLVVAE